MSRLTFLRRIGRPVAILFPVFAGVAAYFEDRAGAAGWGAAFADAIGVLLWFALLYAPLYFAPFFAQRSWRARAGAASLLLPAIALHGFVVLVGAVQLRFNSIGVLIGYLIALACLIVLGAAVAALLSPNPPLERTAAAV
jgi:hypothetical protein